MTPGSVGIISGILLKMWDQRFIGYYFIQDTGSQLSLGWRWKFYGRLDNCRHPSESCDSDNAQSRVHSQQHSFQNVGPETHWRFFRLKTLDPSFRWDDGGNFTVVLTTTVIPAQAGIQCLSLQTNRLTLDRLALDLRQNPAKS
jgi:hypothetical protein